MAITGLIGVGYVVAHMIGNLKMFFGPAEIDHYGEWLRDLLVPALPRTVFLWLMRIVLIVSLFLHLHAAYSLTVMNRRARPRRYQSPRATTSPPTSPAGRCAGPASSSCCSCSSTSPT